MPAGYVAVAATVGRLLGSLVAASLLDRTPARRVLLVSDAGRFLAAGAERSFWLRVPSGELPRAAGMVNKILAQGEHVIVESNSVVELVTPDVFLMLLDFSCEDFKASSLRFMDRADGFVVLDRGINAPLWEEVAKGMWDGKPQFLVKPPRYVTTAVVEFVKSRLSAPSER